MASLRRKKAHMPHTPSPFGLWLNALPKGWKWLFPVQASRRLYLVENDIYTHRLPKALYGLKIAYASDIHYGDLLDDARVDDLVERINALNADIVILGGDYGQDAAHTRRFFERGIHLKAKLAVCGVLGNHDRAGEMGDADELAELMLSCGITPLVNSTITISINGVKLCICATDDLAHGDPAFADVRDQVRGADYVIYAPHSPDSLEALREEVGHPFYDLALCGHTHGGQVSLFGFAPYTASQYGSRFGNAYLSGEIEEEDGVYVMISNGVGTTWMPIRFCAPPQYHLITLRSKEQE